MKALAITAISSGFAQANIVTNGNFENGTAGWNMQGFGIYETWGVGGSKAVVTGCISHNCVSTLGHGAFFKQMLNTTAGKSYNLSFFVGESGYPTSEMSIFWNGSLVADILNPANLTIDFLTNKSMIKFSFNNLLASGNTTALEIHGRQDPAGISFDEISVVASTNDVPEPASIALMGIAIAGLGVARRKMKRSL